MKMKKTVISAAFVGLSLGSKGFRGFKGDVNKFYDDQFGLKSDLDKAGHFYEEHSGAIDGAITTAATVGKILAGDENDDEFGIKQRAEFVAKHGKTIARIASIFGEQNDDEFGVEQRAEWAAKHAGDIAKIASMFGDENDNNQPDPTNRKLWHFFENGLDEQLNFKSDMDKAGDWYSAHSGAVDDAITTAAKIGKTLAGDENDDEYGIKQRANWEWKHSKAIAKVLRAVGDENNDEFGLKKRAEWAAKHAGDIADIAGIFDDENDDQFGFKKDMHEVGHFYEKHDGAIDGAITTAAQVGKIIAGGKKK